MKRKEILQQVKNKSAADITKELAESRDKLWQLRQDLAAGKIKNVREIASMKKYIARMLTLRADAAKNKIA